MVKDISDILFYYSVKLYFSQQFNNISNAVALYYNGVSVLLFLTAYKIKQMILKQQYKIIKHVNNSIHQI